MYYLIINYVLILEWNILRINSIKIDILLIFNYKIILFIFLVIS